MLCSKSVLFLFFNLLVTLLKFKLITPYYSEILILFLLKKSCTCIEFIPLPQTLLFFVQCILLEIIMKLHGRKFSIIKSFVRFPVTLLTFLL
jgi:hypothetical protein